MFLSQLKWLKFLGQNDSIFLSMHREKKLQRTMHMTKLLILKCEWITEKNSFERRAPIWEGKRKEPIIIGYVS